MKDNWKEKGKKLGSPLLMLCLFFIIPLVCLLVFRMKGILINSVFWFLFCIVFFLLPLYYYILNVLDRMNKEWRKHRLSIGLYSGLGVLYMIGLYTIYVSV